MSARLELLSELSRAFFVSPTQVIAMTDHGTIFVSARECERIAQISRWVVMRLALAGGIRFRLTAKGDPIFAADDVLRAAADPKRHRRRRSQVQRARRRSADAECAA